jgi:hypothetical protein
MAHPLEEVRTITILSDGIASRDFKDEVVEMYDLLREESVSLGEPLRLVNWEFEVARSLQDWNVENTSCRHNLIVYLCHGCARDLEGVDDPMAFYGLGIHHSYAVRQ